MVEQKEGVGRFVVATRDIEPLVGGLSKLHLQHILMPPGVDHVGQRRRPGSPDGQPALLPTVPQAS